jgi:uncharacterized protein YrrD
MNTQPELVQYAEVINRLVLDRRTVEELGRVEQLWLNPQTHQIVGLTCKSGFLGGNKRLFTWEQIEAIGNDSIIVNYDPEEIAPEKPESAISLIGHEVWTDAGNKAGKIIDYLFIPQTGAVAKYLFVSNGWRGIVEGVYSLPASAIANVGSKRVIVPDGVVQEPEFHAEGLNQKANQAAEFLKDDYVKTQGDWGALRRTAQNIAGQVKDKAEQVTNIAKEKLAEVKAKQQDAAQQEDTIKTIDTTAEPLPSTLELSEQPIDTTAEPLPNLSELSEQPIDTTAEPLPNLSELSEQPIDTTAEPLPNLSELPEQPIDTTAEPLPSTLELSEQPIDTTAEPLPSTSELPERYK